MFRAAGCRCTQQNTRRFHAAFIRPYPRPYQRCSLAHSAVYQLARLGAEVIKIENPKAATWPAGWELTLKWHVAKWGSRFSLLNADKQSIALDLKDPQGKAIFLDLVAQSDVVSNFRGVMERLGLSYETLSARNPRIIYCAISGFGQTGPWRQP